MKKIRFVFLIAIITLLYGCTTADAVRENRLVNRKIFRSDLDARIYKVVNGQNLQLHIFYPEGYSATGKNKYPAAASIHGGGWTQGPVEWGESDAKFMSSLGFIGIAVEYRLADKKSVSALDCMKDVNSALRWIRIYAKDFNIDPNRVLTIGHSAGGHLSISTLLFPEIIEKGEDNTISSVPNAVIALAPAVALGHDDYFQSLLLGKTKAKDCSPIDNIIKLNIPILIIHGSQDEVLPVAHTEDFVKKMKAAGNNIELKIFSGGKHGLFYDDEEGITFWKDAVWEFVENF